MPEPGMSLRLPVGVSYSADAELVERVLIEETREAAKEIPVLRLDPPPMVRFMPGFGDSSLNFTLICRIATYTDQYVVQDALNKRILARFRKEGIQIPFPQRDVHFFVEKSEEAAKVVVEQPGEKRNGN
jgi:small-conductance mechanosensitive channel